jgi:tetratricopeptide (TPR) repeat protein
MGIRSLAMKRVRSAVDAHEQMTLRAASASGLGRFWERAITDGLLTLAKYYFVSGDIGGLRSIVERASGVASRVADSEVNFTIDRINAFYNSYFMSATDAVGIQEKLIKRSATYGRTDQLLDVADLYSRIQFNTGRRELARLFTLNLLEIANQRRSGRRITMCLEELAYQLSRQGRPSDAARLFSAAKNELPDEEKEFRYRIITDEILPLASRDDDKSNEALQPYRQMLETAAEEGNRWREMLMLEKMMASGHSSIIDKAQTTAEKTPRAYSLGELYQGTLGGVNMFWEIGKRSPMPFDLDGQTNIDLLERAAETALSLDVPDSALGILIDISQIHAKGGIDGVEIGPIAPQSVDLVAALAVAERAVEFADAEEKRSDAKASAAYRQRGDVRRLSGDLANAEQDARRSLRLAKSGNYVSETISACILFANIEFDRRNWGDVLDWFEQAIRELSAHLPYHAQYGTIDCGRLNDLMEERTLRNLKIDDQAIRDLFVANMPRAARLFRDYLILTGQHAGAKSLPLNDFWYWGEALKKSNIPEAAWYYRAAVYRDLYEGKPRKVAGDRMNQLAAQWLSRAEEFSVRAGNREDLEFDPSETFGHLQRRYQN